MASKRATQERRSPLAGGCHWRHYQIGGGGRCGCHFESWRQLDRGANEIGAINKWLFPRAFGGFEATVSGHGVKVNINIST